MPVPPFPDTPRDKGPELFHVRSFKGVNQDAPRAGIRNDEFTIVDKNAGLGASQTVGTLAPSGDNHGEPRTYTGG